MRIIDARTGQDVVIGQWVTMPRTNHVMQADGSWRSFEGPDESYRLLRVQERLLSATVEAEFADGRKHTLKLPVRWMHPSFLFRKTLFIPN
jgi:hypothetical protein